MSVLSALALLAGSVGKVLEVKRKPPHANIDALETKIDDLERQLDGVRRDRDDWMRLCESWRARYYNRADVQREMAEQAALANAFYSQQQNAALAQQAQAQQFMNQLGQQQVGMLAGLQRPEPFCHCVPARHDLFIRG